MSNDPRNGINKFFLGFNLCTVDTLSLGAFSLLYILLVRRGKKNVVTNRYACN
ncbi:hypothetical protein BDV23DRAFT_154300 [Aspergillus alliaceus]|uniref:Uncharacterized protein n=1 Tax=Petromyces alliaceus TaxID=209559 RepID=A0A5N7C9F1_PETAA|nr:hypothetical protein BDV23DRAFT_154300 [Aspergillus alliaceus]